MADMAKLAPAFAKLAEAAQEISDIFAGGGVLGKRAGEFDENGKKKKKEKRAPRAPTAFNMFMKKAVAEAKVANPNLNPKEIFAQCASKWKDAPENPKAGQPVGTLGVTIDSAKKPSKDVKPGKKKK